MRLAQEVRPELRRICCCTKHSCSTNAQGRPRESRFTKYGRYETKSTDYYHYLRGYGCPICLKPFQKIIHRRMVVKKVVRDIVQAVLMPERQEGRRRWRMAAEAMRAEAVRRVVAAVVKAVLEAADANV